MSDFSRSDECRTQSIHSLMERQPCVSDAIKIKTCEFISRNSIVIDKKKHLGEIVLRYKRIKLTKKILEVDTKT